MKRAFYDFGNIFSLESRMRKKAALDDEEIKQRHKISAVSPVVNERKYDSMGNILYKLNALPPKMKHLGGDVFLTVSLFKGHTRVHIRKYDFDQEGFLHPTKEGVSISPIIWHFFRQKVSCSKEDFFVISKHLCVSIETKDDATLILFQRLFQRRNLRYDFTADSVIINQPQFQILRENASNICDQIKSCLITYTLDYFVRQEIENQALRDCLNEYTDFIPNAEEELIDSLSETLVQTISEKISELFQCFECEKGFPKSELHDCVETDRSEKYECLFDEALYKVDWQEVAKKFILLNADKDYFVKCIQEDFLSSVNANMIYNNVKVLYINGKI